MKPLVSVAVDPNYYEVGDFLFVLDLENSKGFFTIAHDTGAAIKGIGRLDLFTGYGREAEKKLPI